jgi:hypothetical protein
VLKFYLQLFILTILAGVAYAFLGPHIPSRFYFDSYVVLLVLFVIVTSLFHIGLQRSFTSGSKAFIRYYMGATGAKLFLFLMMIMIYAFINKAHAVAFALCFFFFYIFYTIFEVSIAYKQFGHLNSASAGAASSDMPSVSNETEK